MVCASVGVAAWGVLLAVSVLAGKSLCVKKERETSYRARPKNERERESNSGLFRRKLFTAKREKMRRIANTQS